MYFVAKDDGSREHFFSVDMSEHNRYKNVAASNRARRSAGAPASGAKAAPRAKAIPDKTRVKQRKAAG